MAERDAPSPQPSLSPAWTRLVCIVLSVVILSADLIWWRSPLFPVIYTIPIAISAWTRSRWFLWALTAILLLASLFGYLTGRADSAGSESVHLANHCLAALSMLVVAGVAHARVISDRWIDLQREALEKQNAELETINEELEQREEEIVRQNEELQSQTEELERQSEELRVTNEELASREKMLEQLLELSRSLTSELTRDEVLKKICEALGFLMSGSATAFLEKEGEDLVMRCHNGFGSEGPETEKIPISQSFSSIIMSLGQTGYLEDTRLRPDLILPKAKNGEPFRSILASPMRVHGRCIGTIELYGPSAQSWGQAQIAVIESLAAQASISLQGADLVEAIRQERRRFEAAFRTMPFGMAITDDPTLQLVRLNPAGAAMLNLPLDENVSPFSPSGIRLRKYIFRGGNAVPKDELPLARAVRGEEVVGEELEFMLPRGSYLTLLISASPIYDARGSVVGAVCGFADITPQRKLLRELEIRRREAEEASLRKTRFLAAVSHDIRTPANAINLMAEVIRRAAGNSSLLPQIPEMAQKLQASTASMMELVGDLLDIARFDTGKIELQESEFSLNELLTQECRQLQPLAEDKQLSLDLSLPDRPVWLRTDRVKLGRVLGNLIGNAIKFTDKGGVKVNATLTADPARRLCISVQDSGVGIPPEHLTRIFDEFAQLRNPERDPTKGAGLGLAISRRLVDVMGGSIGVESRVGEGSTFTVALPASCLALRVEAMHAGELAARSARTEPKSPMAARILLVEDHTTSREGIRQLLIQEGATVVEAPDARSALLRLEEGGFDVVLLDMMLPDMDGREVLKAVQARRPAGLKVLLVLTADLTQERQAEISRLGGDGLVSKPVKVDQLMQVLRQYLTPRD